MFEGVRQGVGRYPFVIPARRAKRRTDASGAVAVKTLARMGQEDRTLDALTDRAIDRPRRPRRERNANHLAALSPHHQCPVTALDAQVLDVGSERLGDPQPVEGEQGDQGVLPGVTEAGDDQHGSCSVHYLTNWRRSKA